MGWVMILCKDLVRNRAAMQKVLKLSSQLGLRADAPGAQVRGPGDAPSQPYERRGMQVNLQKFVMENEIMDMKPDEAIVMGLDTEGTVENGRPPSAPRPSRRWDARPAADRPPGGGGAGPGVGVKGADRNRTDAAVLCRYEQSEVTLRSFRSIRIL
jgi:hypothetical protein